MQIGFSNGVFYTLLQTPEQRYEQKYLDLLSLEGQAKCIELVCLDENTLDYLINSNNIKLSNFSYVSMHAPAFFYADDEDTNRIFYKFQQVAKKFFIKNFVFHPDTVRDWSVFGKYPDLPISIENMDRQKTFGRTLEDIQSILSKFNFGLTLDLQHCYVNDPSMNLAARFQTVLGSRIVQYHLSGSDAGSRHYPLYKAKQDEIISTLSFPDIPIIIESTFQKRGEQEREFKFISLSPFFSQNLSDKLPA